MAAVKDPRKAASLDGDKDFSKHPAVKDPRKAASLDGDKDFSKHRLSQLKSMHKKEKFEIKKVAEENFSAIKNTKMEDLAALKAEVEQERLAILNMLKIYREELEKASSKMDNIKNCIKIIRSFEATTNDRFSTSSYKKECLKKVKDYLSKQDNEHDSKSVNKSDDFDVDYYSPTKHEEMNYWNHPPHLRLNGFPGFPGAYEPCYSVESTLTSTERFLDYEKRIKNQKEENKNRKLKIDNEIQEKKNKELQNKQEIDNSIQKIEELKDVLSKKSNSFLEDRLRRSAGQMSFSNMKMKEIQEEEKIQEHLINEVNKITLRLENFKGFKLKEVLEYVQKEAIITRKIQDQTIKSLKKAEQTLKELKKRFDENERHFNIIEDEKKEFQHKNLIELLKYKRDQTRKFQEICARCKSTYDSLLKLSEESTKETKDFEKRNEKLRKLQAEIDESTLKEAAKLEKIQTLRRKLTERQTKEYEEMMMAAKERSNDHAKSIRKAIENFQESKKNCAEFKKICKNIIIFFFYNFFFLLFLLFQVVSFQV